jgi:hypothetical protein
MLGIAKQVKRRSCIYEGKRTGPVEILWYWVSSLWAIAEYLCLAIMAPVVLVRIHGAHDHRKWQCIVVHVIGGYIGQYVLPFSLNKARELGCRHVEKTDLQIAQLEVLLWQTLTHFVDGTAINEMSKAR